MRCGVSLQILYLCALLGFRERESDFYGFQLSTAFSLSVSILIRFLNTWGFRERKKCGSFSLYLCAVMDALSDSRRYRDKTLSKGFTGGLLHAPLCLYFAVSFFLLSHIPRFSRLYRLGYHWKVCPSCFYPFCPPLLSIPTLTPRASPRVIQFPLLAIASMFSPP